MKNKIEQQHKLKVYPVSMTPAMAATMKTLSKRLPNCPRPEEGSISHGVFHAVILLIDTFNKNLKTCNLEVYTKSMG
jgi:hypothetical protein